MALSSETNHVQFMSMQIGVLMLNMQGILRLPNIDVSR